MTFGWMVRFLISSAVETYQPFSGAAPSGYDKQSRLCLMHTHLCTDSVRVYCTYNCLTVRVSLILLAPNLQKSILRMW